MITYTHQCLRCIDLSGPYTWESNYEYPSRCPRCKSNSYDVPKTDARFNPDVGRRGRVADKIILDDVSEHEKDSPA